MPALYQGFGTLDIMQDIGIALLDGINSTLPVIDTADEERAVIWSDARGVTHVVLVSETVPADHFHMGSVPSFVQVDDRMIDYPLIAIAPSVSTRAGENATTDQYDAMLNYISVFGFVYATEAQGADVAVIKAERMALAIMHVIADDTMLRAKFAGDATPVEKRTEEPWRFPVIDGHGEEAWFCYVTLAYQVRNYATTP